MKKVIAVLFFLSALGMAQDVSQEQKQKAANEEFQRKAAEYKNEQTAEQVARDKKAAEEKTKAEVAAKLDNKNPQPIKDETQRHKLELLNTRRLLSQQKLETLQAIIKPTVQKMMADSQAADKAYNDALAEQQKSHHAEGCQIVYDEKGDVKVSKDGKEVWDCAKAGK